MTDAVREIERVVEQLNNMATVCREYCNHPLLWIADGKTRQLHVNGR
jgi:hypothetical protein